MGRGACLSYLLAFVLTACGPMLKEKPATSENVAQPKNAKEAQKMLKEGGKDIVYGEGLGELGASVLIPPYGIYKLGQAAAGLAGYELDATEALPGESKKTVRQLKDAVVSVPGRAAATVAGEEYRGKGKALKGP